MDSTHSRDEKTQNRILQSDSIPQPTTRWVPTIALKKPSAVDYDSPQIIDRKVKALLNKLTLVKFDSVSDQIIAWANKSENEKDGRTMIQVLKLVYEVATDQAMWSEMYARLCRKMMEQISPHVQDGSTKNAEGKPITGAQLFRKFLLNRFQEDFELLWVANETAAVTTSTVNGEKSLNLANKKPEKRMPALFSDEYYAAQKAKRQGLGVIKLIGELFKVQMLTERIIHECVKKLLGSVEYPQDEEMERLCVLLRTVGAAIDTKKARAHMDVYFSRIKGLMIRPDFSLRIRFMLQDVIELRERRWISRNLFIAPTAIAQIREAAGKEKAAQERESYQRRMSITREDEGVKEGVKEGEERIKKGSRKGKERIIHITSFGPSGSMFGTIVRLSPSTPPEEQSKRQLGELALTKENISTPLASAIVNARFITDLDCISYPEGVLKPKLELNANAKDGQLIYDRGFLLQFMMVCRDKPDMLPPLDVLGIFPVERPKSVARGGARRHRQRSGASSFFVSRPPNDAGISSTTTVNNVLPSRDFSAGRMGQFGKDYGRRIASAECPAPNEGGPRLNPSSSVRTRSKRGTKQALIDGYKGSGNQEEQ